MKAIQRIKLSLVATVTVLALALPVAAGDDEKVKLGDCPAAVQKTIKEKAADGQIVEIERETKKDGTVVYEAEVKTAGGQTIDIEVAADGKLLKTEVDDDEDDDDGEDDDQDDKK